MTKLTNELKAKFFALYYDQVVYMEGGMPQPGFVNGSRIGFILNGNGIDAHLLLKPLSAITDEDAIKVAKIEGYTYDYLRSRGYALPFMGISVEQQIEAGWIKLIEK